MNWLKRLLNDALLKRVKSDLLREIDRAIGKLETGQTAADVIPILKRELLRVLTGKLPAGAGAFLLDILLMSVDWVGFVSLPVSVVLDNLLRIRKRVEGARL